MTKQANKKRKVWLNERDLVRPTAVDAHVGERVKQRRLLLSMSQVALSKHLGVRFQQLQKYERGSNRISASRLLQLSNALEVPIQYFFDDMPPGVAGAVSVTRGKHKYSPPRDDPSVMLREETIKLVHAYYAIESKKIRRKLLEIIREAATEAQ